MSSNISVGCGVELIELTQCGSMQSRSRAKMMLMNVADIVGSTRVVGDSLLRSAAALPRALPRCRTARAM